MTQLLSTRQSFAHSLLRDPGADGVLVGCSLAHAAVLLMWPSFLTVGLGLWWNANTVSHYFIHRPFFRAPATNAGFSVLLSLLLGLPQSVWRDRHRAHHAGIQARVRIHPQLVGEVLAVTGLLAALLWWAPGLFLTVWLPGVGLGLAICAVHGHYEHVGGGTISHYGRLYNFLFFNDGYHVEHHAAPACRWRELPARRMATAPTSAWPAVLRCLDYGLEVLERLVLRPGHLQRYVLAVHRRAWRRFAADLQHVRRVGIVGGGLFPRTAILLRELVPAAKLTIIDGDPGNLDLARHRLGAAVEYREEWFGPGDGDGFDMLVIPLAYRGAGRHEVCQLANAPIVVCHDWIWERQQDSVVVSPWLLKRMSLYRREARP